MLSQVIEIIDEVFGHKYYMPQLQLVQHVALDLHVQSSAISYRCVDTISIRYDLPVPALLLRCNRSGGGGGVWFPNNCKQ